MVCRPPHSPGTSRAVFVAMLILFLLAISLPCGAEMSKEAMHLRMIELARQMEELKPRIASSPIDAWAWSQKSDEYQRMSDELGGDDPGRALPGKRVAAASAAPVAVPPVPAGCTAVTLAGTNTNDVMIPAGPSVVSSSITVSDFGASIWNVEVETFITHRFPGDLDITLRSPDGTVVTLTTDNGSFRDDVFNGTLWTMQGNPGGQVPYDQNPGLVTDHPYVDSVTASPLVPEESLHAFRGRDPNGIWTLTISDDSPSNDGMLDSWTLRLSGIAVVMPLAAGHPISSPGVVIPDPGIVTSTIHVPRTGNITDVFVRLKLEHTDNEDLDITLQSPSGTVVTLTTDNGGSFDDVFNQSVFADEADPGGQVPYASNDGLVTDHPYVDGTAVGFLVSEEGLGAFVGESPQGDWILTISDDFAGGAGQLVDWTLEVLLEACVSADQPRRADARPSGGISDQNGVAEPGERFVFEPRWRTAGSAAAENFDGVAVSAPRFPPDWVPLLLAGQPQNVTWRTIASPFCHSPPHCAASQAPVNVTDNRLTTPSWGPITLASLHLNFWHSYAFQDGFDGGVLEISINGGAFQDILDAGGTFVQEGYTDTLSTCCASFLGGRQAWSGDSGGFVETIVNLPNAARGQDVRLRFRVGTDAGTASGGWFIDTITLGGAPALFMSGSAEDFFPDFGEITEIHDATADYDLILRGASNGCFEASGNCYELRVGNLLPRPALHWEPLLREVTSLGVVRGYQIHLGDSFTDVARVSPYYRFVETILHNGVTAGCGPTTFCPAGAVLREQMAVFIIEAMNENTSNCAVPIFNDVPCTSPYASFINRLSVLGITGGCGSGNFCPTSPVLREQMAVFLLVALEGSGYTPPSCTTPLFGDVPCSSVYARWINELSRRGITGGCGGGTFCPGLSVTREQMAVFLTVTFALQLY